MHIVIVSDAWTPQINGVVHTITRTRDELVKLGHQVTVIGPDRFRNVPCPTYPEIRLALFPGRRLRRLLEEAKPDAIHISTEGPLGLSARRWCLKNNFPFTNSSDFSIRMTLTKLLQIIKIICGEFRQWWR